MSHDPAWLNVRLASCGCGRQLDVITGAFEAHSPPSVYTLTPPPCPLCAGDQCPVAGLKRSASSHVLVSSSMAWWTDNTKVCGGGADGVRVRGGQIKPYRTLGYRTIG